MIDTEQKHLLIDSRDRTAGTSIQNATYLLDRPIQDFKCVRVNFVQLYNTFWNVTTLNNEFSVSDGAVISTRQLTPGHYSGATLATAINTLLQAISATLTVTFDTSTNLLNWTLPAPYSLVLGKSSDKLLGIAGLTTLTGTFTSIPNTTTPNSVQFFSPELQGNDQSYYTNNDSKHLCPFLTVPVFAQFGSSNYYQSNYPILVHTQSNCLQRFTIQLLDGEGNALQNAIDHQVSLTFF